MKRRNFLKAIGLGALVAPAVVKAAGHPPIERNRLKAAFNRHGVPYPEGQHWTVPNQKVFVHRAQPPIVVNRIKEKLYMDT